MKKIFVLIMALMMICISCVPAFADDLELAQKFEGMAKEFYDKGQYTDAGDYYRTAGSAYSYCKQFTKAYDCYGKSGDAFTLAGDPDEADISYGYQKNIEGYTDSASIFSGGSLTIIVGLASAAIFGLLGFLLGRKSRTVIS